MISRVPGQQGGFRGCQAVCRGKEHGGALAYPIEKGREHGWCWIQFQGGGYFHFTMALVTQSGMHGADFRESGFREPAELVDNMDADPWNGSTVRFSAMVKGIPGFAVPA